MKVHLRADSDMGYVVVAELEGDEPQTAMWQREILPGRWVPTRTVTWQRFTYWGARWKARRAKRRAIRERLAYERRQRRAEEATAA